MTDILQAVSAQLRVNAGVIALVGTKVYPYSAPAGVDVPFITINKGQGPRWDIHEGGPVLVANRVSVTAWSASYDQTALIANAVVTCLRRFSGTLGGNGGVPVQSVLLVGDFSVHDPSKMFGAVRDFEIMYREVV